MNLVIINGIKYQGKNISVCGNKVIIDGKDATPDNKEIIIKIEGNVTELKVDVCNKIEIWGEVSNIKTKSGDVDVSGNVLGSIQTMSGDVDCGTINGSVSTMSGDIKYRKA